MKKQRRALKPAKIKVRGPWFFSPHDEDVFFAWLKSVPAVRAIGGVGYALEITLARPRLSLRDSRELLAIFRRYRLNKRGLSALIPIPNPKSRLRQ
jgi:hypothetical protein